MLERLERRGHGDAALDVGAEVGEDELDGRDLGRDVEDVEPADVAEPEDLPLQLALAVRDRDPEAVADAPDDVAGVDARRRADRGHDRAPVLVRREELEAERLHARARGAAEPDVPVERSLQSLLEQEVERDVEPRDERDGQRDRRVELLLRLARPLPVEVEARRRPGRATARPRRRRRGRARAGS